jgi:hypothetical protein
VLLVGVSKPYALGLFPHHEQRSWRGFEPILARMGLHYINIAHSLPPFLFWNNSNTLNTKNRLIVHYEAVFFV